MMGYVAINEAVEVTARFSTKGRILPLAFSWRGRLYRLQKTTYRWRTGKGRSTIHYFAVTSSTDDSYQLCYCDEDAVWTLEKLWTPD